MCHTKLGLNLYSSEEEKKIYVEITTTLKPTSATDWNVMNFGEFNLKRQAGTTYSITLPNGGLTGLHEILLQVFASA